MSVYIHACINVLVKLCTSLGSNKHNGYGYHLPVMVAAVLFCSPILFLAAVQQISGERDREQIKYILLS